MSLIFSDGFDVYGEVGTSNHDAVINHWGSGSFIGQAQSIVQQGRHSGGKSAVLLGDDGNDAIIQTELPTVVTSGLFIIGFNFKRASVSAGNYVIYLNDIDSSFGTSKSPFHFSGGSNVIRSFNVAIGKSIVDDQWHHVEIVYDTTADIVYLYLDEELIHTASYSLDPRYIRIYDRNTSGYSTNKFNFIDDFYVLDDTGDSANGRLGDSARIDTIFPSGETSVADWTTLETNTWGAISGTPEDDTTSIFAVSSGDTTLFNWTDIQSTGIVDVNAISIRGRSEDVDLAGVTFQPVMSGTALVDIGDLVNTPTITDNFYMTIDVNPETGSQFTESEINSLELGFRSH